MKKKLSPFVCENPKCEFVGSIISNIDNRGVCSGVLTKSKKDSPKEDRIRLCFVEADGTDQYTFSPEEALETATVLTMSFSRFVKVEHPNAERKIRKKK